MHMYSGYNSLSSGVVLPGKVNPQVSCRPKPLTLKHHGPLRLRDWSSRSMVYGADYTGCQASGFCVVECLAAWQRGLRFGARELKASDGSKAAAPF